MRFTTKPSMNLTIGAHSATQSQNHKTWPQQSVLTQSQNHKI